MAHLLKYDSVLGQYPEPVKAGSSGIKAGDDELQVLSVRNPAELPWGDLGVDLVVESTGIFTSRRRRRHTSTPAPRSSSCRRRATGADATFVYGVNHKDFDPKQHKVISDASCTTNCFVPLVKVLDDAFGVEQGLMTTVHAYTGDQMLVDGPHRDLRRAACGSDQHRPDEHRRREVDVARAGGDEGASLDGTSLRVPVPTGSVTDFNAVLKTEATRRRDQRRVRQGGQERPAQGRDPLHRRADRVRRHRQ